MLIFSIWKTRFRVLGRALLMLAGALVTPDVLLLAAVIALCGGGMLIVLNS